MEGHWRLSVLAAVIASAACFNPLSPENESRKDPGTVVAEVRDPSGAPIAGVWVYVELPNSIGSFFMEGSPTRADGKVRFQYIPAGRRPVEVKLPPGYSVEGERRRDVDVIKGQTVTTQFTLRRD
jgi:hypothetical protein